MSEELCVVAVKWIDFDPLPKCTNRCIVMLTTNGFKPSSLPFSKADATDNVSISQAIGSQNKYYAVFMSPILKIPPTPQKNEFDAIAYFLLPRSRLNGKLVAYLAVQSEKDLELQGLPGTIVGCTDFLEDDLKRLLGKDDKPQMTFPVGYISTSTLYDELSLSKCVLEMACVSSDREMRQKSQYRPPSEEHKRYKSENLELMPGDSDKWQVVSRELAQKQEIIDRLMKDVDEKKQSLKVTSAEIIDLRRNIKLLQNENAILRRRLGEEEQIQLNQMVTKEINKMSIEELRMKVLKLAQAYREERLRNEKYDTALKGAHMELSAAKKMETELESMQNANQDKAKKLLNVQHEMQKINLYKDTIKKQEKVISKLELLLDKTIKDVKEPKEKMLEFEKLRLENIELKEKLKPSKIQRSEINPDVERYRKEITQLEEQVTGLQKQLQDKRVKTPNDSEQYDREKIELEVKLQKAEARNIAIEEEMQQNAINYGKGIANLRAELIQKDNKLRAMGINPDDTIM